MKKLTSITLALCLLLSLFAFAANAAAATKITVTVTIADKSGKLVLAAEPVEVRDVDGDSLFTVHDTLTCAHEQYYGSADGYEAADSVIYGLGMTKLWGESNGGGFGYFCNDASCWSLRDEVKQSDRVTAFVYPENWSETHYAFCDPYAAEVKTGKLLKLTVKKVDYDLETWEPIDLPVVGATITVDGEKTRFVTDEKGEVRIFLNDEGEHLISVVSDTEILVPFAVKVQVNYNALSYVQGLLLSVLYPVVNWILHLFNK